MCGIAGFAGVTQDGLLEGMCQRILHRGPDSEGMARLPEQGMAIGMRRLAIIDLAGGEQPFVSEDGKVQLVMNGELYNFRTVREELLGLGHRFFSQSDTEVALQAYLAWGHEAWKRLQGMFAIAILDSRGVIPALHVVRDRVGMKPVYYIQEGEAFLFASEMKALTLWRGFRADVRLEGIWDYLALRYVPGPNSLFHQVRKLPAGHVATYRGGQMSMERWWVPPGRESVRAMSAEEAVADFGGALRQSVREHMISDVPLGAFLSGGIDSNALVALMAEASSTPVKTFSIGFPDFDDSDRNRAAITAKALGTEHYPIECSAMDMLSLPDIMYHLDEPVGDAIVVPMFVLAREARKQVTVVLSGEGADEILGGYMFHRKLSQLEKLRSVLPPVVWQLAARLVGAVPPALLNPLFDYPGTLGESGKRKIISLLELVGRAPLPELYRRAVALFDAEDMASVAAYGPLGRMAGSVAGPELDVGKGTPLQRLVQMQYPDWLPDDILMKADKMCMAHSLEGRIPFMDARVIEAAARLPDRFKLGARTTKWALRQAVAPLLPKEIHQAPKRAFYLPLESYMHTPQMQEMTRHYLSAERLRRRGLFKPEAVAALQSAGNDAGFLPLKRVFSLLALELWFEKFCPDASWG